MRQRQILNLEGYNLSVDQIEIMCQKYRDLGQVSANKLVYFILQLLFSLSSLHIIQVTRLKLFTNYYLSTISLYLSLLDSLLVT
jgi:hypothetical protein